MKIWAILGIILALSAMGSGIYVAGKRATRAEYAERDNAAIKAAYEARDAALVKVAEAENKHRTDMAAIVSTTTEKVSNVQTNLTRALADVATGKLRLRNLARCPAPSDRGSPGQTGSATGLAADADADRRAKEDAGFLIAFSAERDKIAVERNSCAEIATRDRQRQ